MKRCVSKIIVLASMLCVAFALVGCNTQSYQPEDLTPTVSTPTIGQNGVLRVGVDASNPPFAGKIGSDIVGMDVDVAAALADQLGLKLEIKNVEANGAAALAAGDVDVLMMASKNNTDSNMWVSEPYVETAVALFAGEAHNTTPTPASNPIIAAQSASMSAWAIENTFGDDALYPLNDLVSAFSAAEKGEAAYVAADAVIGTYVAKTQNVNLRIIALLDKPSGYCIGVSAANTDLQNAVAGTLKNLKDGGIVKIVSSKWLGSDLALSQMPLVEAAAHDTNDADNDADKKNTHGDDAGSDKPAVASNAVLPQE